jgi:hypothetical protein
MPSPDAILTGLGEVDYALLGSPWIAAIRWWFARLFITGPQTRAARANAARFPLSHVRASCAG